MSSRSLVLAFAGTVFRDRNRRPAGSRRHTPPGQAGRAAGRTRGFGIAGSLAARGHGRFAEPDRGGHGPPSRWRWRPWLGIGLMIGSFRISVEDWLTGTLTADVYVNIDGEQFFDDSHRDALSAIPGVRGSSLTRFIRLPTAAGRSESARSGPGTGRLGAAHDGQGVRMQWNYWNPAQAFSFPSPSRFIASCHLGDGPGPAHGVRRAGIHRARRLSRLQHQRRHRADAPGPVPIPLVRQRHQRNRCLSGRRRRPGDRAGERYAAYSAPAIRCGSGPTNSSGSARWRSLTVPSGLPKY